MDATRQNTIPAVGEEVADADPEPRLDAAVRYSIYFVALCLGAATLYFARAFFMPVALAFLLALTLSPIVRAARHQGIPHVISAAALVSTVAVGLVAGGVLISAPAARWIEMAPSIGMRLEKGLDGFRAPVEAVARAERRVEEATQTDEPAAEVVVQGPSLLSRAADNVLLFVAMVGLTLLLAVFILSSSDVFYAKLIRLAPTLTAKKNALSLVYNIEGVVSRYLLTITVINCGLGLAIGIAMWMIGMPSPHLWGAAATMLNFMPYVGMILGVAVVGAVALVSFDTITYAMLAPLAYLALTSIEGGIITPVVLGRRLALNTVAILLAIGFWGWLWGVVGLLIAVPLLVVTKVVCDNVPGLAPLGEILSGDREVGAAAQRAARGRRPATGTP